MNITKLIILIANRLKPLLLKIVPHKLLRKFKKKMITNSIDSMEKIKIIPFQPDKYKFGINLIGNIKAESGLGQSCRLVADVLQESGIDFSIYNYSQLGNVKEADGIWEDRINSEFPYNMNLIHINPYEFSIAFPQLPSSVWNHRYNIAFWLWELEEFPDEWVPCISCLNEIWTPSEFISNSLRKKTSIPVKTMPYSVNVSIHTNYDRSYFKLPNHQFLFLMMYDSYSIFERKNPKGVMDAFKKAFDQSNEKVGLIIKINNATKKDIHIINNEMGGYSNIYIIAETLNKDQVNSLIKCSDVYVSLHRAEGFGLVLAEAMLLGVPTIATNWSSNTEFMNKEVACMVNYKLIELDRDMGPFKKGNRWADPDIEEAAEYMKKLYSDQEYYQNIVCKARKHIQDKLSINRATGLLIERMNEIMEQYE